MRNAGYESYWRAVGDILSNKMGELSIDVFSEDSPTAGSQRIGFVPADRLKRAMIRLNSGIYYCADDKSKSGHSSDVTYRMSDAFASCLKLLNKDNSKLLGDIDHPSEAQFGYACVIALGRKDASKKYGQVLKLMNTELGKEIWRRVLEADPWGEIIRGNDRFHLRLSVDEANADKAITKDFDYNKLPGVLVVSKVNESDKNTGNLLDDEWGNYYLDRGEVPAYKYDSAWELACVKYAKEKLPYVCCAIRNTRETQFNITFPTDNGHDVQTIYPDFVYMQAHKTNDGYECKPLIMDPHNGKLDNGNKWKDRFRGIINYLNTRIAHDGKETVGNRFNGFREIIHSNDVEEYWSMDLNDPETQKAVLSVLDQSNSIEELYQAVAEQEQTLLQKLQ